MLDTDEINAAADLGVRTAESRVVALNTGYDELDDSLIVRVLQGDERLEHHDLERQLSRPRETRGSALLHDPGSFSTYVTRMHGTGEAANTTLWADEQRRSITAVFNDHLHAGLAGWRDHTATLQVRTDPDWEAWTGRDGKLTSQITFGEHLEDQAHTIVNPPAAELVQIATTLTAKRNVAFEQSTRLQSGDVAFTYRESTQATGSVGRIEVPERFTIRLAPFLGVGPIDISARLRYRISADGLQIGYRLQRPDIAEREAFETIQKAVDDATPADVPMLWGARPGPLR